MGSFVGFKKGTPESTGRTPESTGRTPESTGRTPESTGRTPESTGIGTMHSLGMDNWNVKLVFVNFTIKEAKWDPP